MSSFFRFFFRLFRHLQDGIRILVHLPLPTRVLLCILAIGVASVPLGWVSQSSHSLEALPLLEAGTDTFENSEWRPNSTYAGELPPCYQALQHRGSFVNGDNFTGTQLSGWYQAQEHVALLVSGYPTLAPNRLEIEVRVSTGEIHSILFDRDNPREAWGRWDISLPPEAVAFRVKGTDAAQAWGGWLGFTQPFAPSLVRSIDLAMIGQTIGAVALAVLLVLGPGIMWRAWRGSSFINVIWPGPVWLAAGGATCWALGGLVPAALVAATWLGVSLVAFLWFSVRPRAWTVFSSTELLVLLLVPMCVLGAAAKAALSGGPSGELYHGRISRTLEVGDRGDSRISFHTVQLVANHLSPNEPEGAKYFAPWHFSARGPLAGLAATPLVLALGGQPPMEQPDQPWMPWDPQGFASYRIVMMALASLALVAVAGLIQHVSDDRRAWVGAGLLALSPFFWHEIYFTWPKLISAAFVLGGFQALLSGGTTRPALWLGAAYLLHPLALLSVPFFQLWMLLERHESLWRRWGRAVLFGTIILAILGTWLLAAGSSSSQGGFLQYFRAADGVYDVPASQWWASRWASLLNTAAPFHAFFTLADHPAFNAIGTRSSDVVHFFLQYWTSAPFAVGLVGFTILLPSFLDSIRRKPGVAFTVLILPALFLVLYWGITITGLMREAGHVLFLSGWVFLLWADNGRLRPLGPTLLTLRAIEIITVIFLPALVGSSWDSTWRLNDAFWCIIVVVAVAGVAWIAARWQPVPAEAASSH